MIQFGDSESQKEIDQGSRNLSPLKLRSDVRYSMDVQQVNESSTLSLRQSDVNIVDRESISEINQMKESDKELEQKLQFNIKKNSESVIGPLASDQDNLNLFVNKNMSLNNRRREQRIQSKLEMQWRNYFSGSVRQLIVELSLLSDIGASILFSPQQITSIMPFIGMACFLVAICVSIFLVKESLIRSYKGKWWFISLFVKIFVFICYMEMRIMPFISQNPQTKLPLTKDGKTQVVNDIQKMYETQILANMNWIYLNALLMGGGVCGQFYEMFSIKESTKVRLFLLLLGFTYCTLRVCMRNSQKYSIFLSVALTVSLILVLFINFIASLIPFRPLIQPPSLIIETKAGKKMSEKNKIQKNPYNVQFQILNESSKPHTPLIQSSSSLSPDKTIISSNNGTNFKLASNKSITFLSNLIEEEPKDEDRRETFSQSQGFTTLRDLKNQNQIINKQLVMKVPEQDRIIEVELKQQQNKQSPDMKEENIQSDEECIDESPWSQDNRYNNSSLLEKKLERSDNFNEKINEISHPEIVETNQNNLPFQELIMQNIGSGIIVIDRESCRLKYSNYQANILLECSNEQVQEQFFELQDILNSVKEIDYLEEILKQLNIPQEFSQFSSMREILLNVSTTNVKIICYRQGQIEESSQQQQHQQKQKFSVFLQKSTFIEVEAHLLKGLDEGIHVMFILRKLTWNNPLLIIHDNHMKSMILFHKLIFKLSQYIEQTRVSISQNSNQEVSSFQQQHLQSNLNNTLAKIDRMNDFLLDFQTYSEILNTSFFSNRNEFNLFNHLTNLQQKMREMTLQNQYMFTLQYDESCSHLILSDLQSLDRVFYNIYLYFVDTYSQANIVTQINPILNLQTRSSQQIQVFVSIISFIQILIRSISEVKEQLSFINKEIDHQDNDRSSSFLMENNQIINNIDILEKRNYGILFSNSLIKKIESSDRGIIFNSEENTTSFSFQLTI